MASLSLRPRWSALGLLFILQSTPSLAHDHHDMEIPEGQFISEDPIDTTLWVHIFIQMVTFGIIFPTGMVLGIVKSKWHVPTQIFGSCLAVLGYLIGHHHGGREFKKNIHSSFANTLMLLLICQIAFGIYLKLHLDRGFHGKIRKYVVGLHGILGKVMPVVSWVQIVFGAITALGFCHEDHLGQCLAHFIMGSAFIGYGIILTIVMLAGQTWLKKTGRSQEFFDSLIIAAWGCVNTFTEHRWGHEWVGNDIQHTTMGIVWWAAGLVGLWLSRKTDGGARRNFIPGFVILITGWAMSAHPQHLEISTMIHTAFGWTLMAAGFTRIIEVCFVLRDQNSLPNNEINSFQYIPPFLLYASGFLFMSATEEQMQLISDSNISHVSYVLTIYSFAFLLFLFVNMLLHLYAAKKPEAPVKGKDVEGSAGRMNGHARAEREQLRDAEEFELDGLMSEDENENPESPSTLGKNNEARV